MSKEQYRAVLDLLARKLIEDEACLGVEFPYVKSPADDWETMPASFSAGYQGTAWSYGNWFCGFWVGLMFAANLHTGDAHYRRIAHERRRDRGGGSNAEPVAIGKH